MQTSFSFVFLFKSLTTTALCSGAEGAAGITSKKTSHNNDVIVFPGQQTQVMNFLFIFE